ncbi:hypothetical protein CLOACE_17900 [Clostridium acetireducens DSM 10703]|uniref:Uncharacterized protein n=1 Tax=Clostridium acetireducens DSM 10703 TaxID=1121290 RepID=A0A1E8EX26_9CLOT|nr:tetratricopeptide repeat protein [Clostridium acetireducens]OFI05342.1 hypothetical protein CLOACE_17900 [Clostridium acetireducens DSM 10703]
MMKVAKQVSLKPLQSKIKQNYGIDINEKNCSNIISMEFAKNKSSKEYLDNYINTYVKGNELEWACYMYLFSKAVEKRSVEKTEKYYKKLKKYEDNYYTESIMGDILLRYYGDLFKAKDKFLNALKLKKEDLSCCYNLGVLYYLLGMFDKSEYYYQLVVDNNKETYNENFNLKGKALYNIAVYNINISKNLEKAKEYLEKSIVEIPDYVEAKNLLEKLKGAI